MRQLIRSSLTGLALTSLALLTPVAASSANAAQPGVRVSATSVSSTGTCHPGAEIRNSPSSSAPLNGTCEPPHSVTVFCLMGMPNGSSWANSLDNTTGVAGWINLTQIDVSLLRQPALPCT
ncbi:hypothetical protein [Flindersiella endophytica]